ncbi:hypothetical protein BFC17_18275 [Alteromonas lipolytica]|uniref:Uncharacterized protein n=1 Tax=Alteromonas lipolytica TaxID=1856405 RepID=A0A1E8FER5_9ALTE|nr:hypothetical protein BFC17_18275 [Alteromonas lipolytica]
MSAILTALIVSASLSGCVINVGGHSSADYHGDVTKVFGGIDIGENRQSGDLTTVNGNISLRDNVTAEELTTVNGSVTIGDFCEIDGVTVVNGDIEAGKMLVSHDGMESVNGDISLAPGARVDGSLTSVNGDISVADIQLTGSIETANGDIMITGNSLIKGDIVYDDPENNDSHSTPELTIDESVQLDGEIILKRDVVLHIPATMQSKVRYQSTAM